MRSRATFVIMPQIDFHILPDDSARQRLEYACRLAAKAWRSGFSVYLHCRDTDESQQLDQLLWEVPAAGFIAHGLQAASQPPVLIGCDASQAEGWRVLINLDLQVPANFAGYERIIEVVNQDKLLRDALRTSFAFYRDRGYSPQPHHPSPELRESR